jgi:hypothetical protein
MSLLFNQLRKGGSDLVAIPITLRFNSTSRNGSTMAEGHPNETKLIVTVIVAIIEVTTVSLYFTYSSSQASNYPLSKSNTSRSATNSMSHPPLAFVILVLTIDLIMDDLWGSLNSRTSYAGWNAATIIAYHHLIPLAASIGLAGKVA